MLIFIYIQVKSTKIKDFTPSIKYNSDIFFIIILIKKNKSRKLSPQKIRKNIVSLLFNKFFNSLSCMKKNAISQSFNINNFINKSTKKKTNLNQKGIRCVYKYFEQEKNGKNGLPKNN